MLFVCLFTVRLVSRSRLQRLFSTRSVVFTNNIINKSLQISDSKRTTIEYREIDKKESDTRIDRQVAAVADRFPFVHDRGRIYCKINKKKIKKKKGKKIVVADGRSMLYV